MRRRDLFAPSLTLALAASAGAAAAEASSGNATPGQPYVDLSPTALPVIEDGRLRNYVFVAVRVALTPAADPLKVRAKEPYFRDALVRAAHRTPFTVPGDPTRLDEARLKASLLRDAVAIAGRGVVKGVEVISQTPRRRTGFARPNSPR